MALPPGVVAKTVTFGIASFFDGTIASGRVTISAPVNVIHTPSNRPLFSSDMTKSFVDGTASFDLCPTDADGLNRKDFAYKAKIEITGAAVQPEVLYFLLPQAGPDVVDLDGLVTVPSSAGVPISVDVLTTDSIDPATAAYVADPTSQTGAALRAAFGSSSSVLPWVLPRGVEVPSMPKPPVVDWPQWFGGDLYPNNLPFDSPAVSHPAGTYEEIDFYGSSYLHNTVNAPATGPWDDYHEFTASGTTVAIRIGVFDDNATEAFARVLVDGRLAYSGSSGAGGVWYLRLTFPFAATRQIRVELRNLFFGGISYPNDTDVYPPTGRKPRAALYGDSWVGGAGDVLWSEFTSYRLALGLDWEVARMGHGGSGYVTDATGESAPMTDSTRLGKLATQGLDFVIVQGSVNDDDGTTPQAVGAAAASVYAYLAQHSPATKVIVVGPQPSSSGLALAADKVARRAANRDAIRAAALAAPNVVRFLDPLGQAWLTDPALYLADGVHPNAAGHAAWTLRLMQEIAKP